MLNRVPNLNHYPVNPYDERFVGFFPFLPFVGGLAVGALAGGFGGGRPCNGCSPQCPQMCPPMYAQPMPMPVQMMPMQPQFAPMPIQPVPAQMQPQYQNVQGPLVESNKFFVR